MEQLPLIHRFKAALHALLYSNVFIALCAAGFTQAHLRWLCYQGPHWPLLSLVFGGTLAGYLALRLEGARRLDESGHVDRLLWVDQHRRLAWGLLATGIVLALAGFWKVQPDTRLALVPAVLLFLAYGWPFLPIPDRFRLRQRPYLKVFLIAAVWTWVGVGLPIVETWDWNAAEVGLQGPFHWLHQPADYPPPGMLLLPMLGRFLFVVAITLPFDIRDIELDRVRRVQTLPSWLGIRRSIQLSLVLLMASLVLGAVVQAWPVYASLSPTPPIGHMGLPFHGGVWIWALLMPQVALVLATAFLVQRSRPMPDRRYKAENAFLYLGWLDGTLLLHALSAGIGMTWAGF